MAITTEEQTCYRHPSRETGVSCSNCGRPICPECMTPTPVGMRCPECTRQKTQVRTARSLSAPVTTATLFLVIVNVVIFLAEGRLGIGTSNGANGSDLIGRGELYGPLVHSEPYRLLTNAFLHEDLLHIGFNMYLLYVLGQQLETLHGTLRFSLLYLASLFAGSVGLLVLQPGTAAIGASGAVFGLFGVAAVEMRARGINVLQSQLGILIILNLVLSFRPGIGFGAHLGGLVGGGLCAVALDQMDRRRVPRNVATAAIGAFAVAFAVAGFLVA